MVLMIAKISYIRSYVLVKLELVLFFSKSILEG